MYTGQHSGGDQQILLENWQKIQLKGQAYSKFIKQKQVAILKLLGTHDLLSNLLHIPYIIKQVNQVYASLFEQTTLQPIS